MIPFADSQDLNSKVAHTKELAFRMAEGERMSDSEHEGLTLELPDAELFAEALSAPPTLGPRLADAARRYEEEFLNHEHEDI